MSERRKLYLVSLIGISVQPGRPVRYAHVPKLMDALSIDDVRDEACEELNKSLPPDFDVRHVVIRPLPTEYYERLLNFAGFDLLARSGEPVEKGIEFLCSPESADPQNDIIFESYDLPM